MSSPDRPRRRKTIGGVRSRPMTQGSTRAMVAKRDLETVAEAQSPTRTASTNSPTRRRPSTQGGVANNVNVSKFLKWNPSGDSKDPRRHMGSSEAHARRQRIARVRQKQPALVDQLMKDLKKRLVVGKVKLWNK